MSSKVESVAIPVVEEQLRLDRETVETGRVRVTTVPEERTETISEPVIRSDVIVERVARNEEVESVPPIRQEGETMVVPVVEERLVKKLFLVEEVRLSRRTTSETVEQEIKLRSQRAVVEREEPGGNTQQEE
ncbi:MAG TPA: YsnF/AvaK domain-containing protein [Sphingomicrobium sp.]